jgi:hypothetical protein
MRRVLRALHEAGCEPGRVESKGEESQLEAEWRARCTLVDRVTELEDERDSLTARVSELEADRDRWQGIAVSSTQHAAAAAEPDAWGVFVDGKCDSVSHRLFRQSSEEWAKNHGGTVAPLYATPLVVDVSEWGYTTLHNGEKAYLASNVIFALASRGVVVKGVL